MKFQASSIDPGDLAKGAELARAGRLILVKGDMVDVLPGIDLHIAPDTHSFASLWIKVRNDRRKDSSDVWVLAGDLVYAYENLGGRGSMPREGKAYRPIGFAIGSQMNLLLTTEEMLTAVGHERRCVVPVHEGRLREVFPLASQRAGAGHLRNLPCRRRRLQARLISGLLISLGRRGRVGSLSPPRFSRP